MNESIDWNVDALFRKELIKSIGDLTKAIADREELAAALGKISVLEEQVRRFRAILLGE